MQGGRVIVQSGHELGPQEVSGGGGEIQEKMVSKLHGWSCCCTVHKGSWIAAPCEFRKDEEAVPVFPVSDARQERTDRRTSRADSMKNSITKQVWTRK